MSSPAANAQFLTFYVSDSQFATRATDVSEVFRRPRITRVPNSPPSLLGIAGLRGAAAPVVSLSKLLGGEDKPSGEARLLMMKGDQPVALAVDRVGALTTLPTAADEGVRQGIGRLYHVEDGGLRVVNLEEVLLRDFSWSAMPRRTTVDVEQGTVEEVEDYLALLGFELDGQTYSMSLDEVDEVLSLPGELTTVAEAHEAALGVMNLRGQLLPIVSLPILLGLAGREPASAKVIVARIGDARVGLVVDRLTAILRVPVGAIGAAPAALNRGKGTAQVESICRLPDSGGLVAVLSSERLFSDEKTAQILADGRSEATTMAADETSSTERFVIFRLGGEEYGLPLAAVDEVVRLPETLTRVPNAPAFIEGVLNLRGKVTPIIDQRRRFHSEPRGDAIAPRIVVTALDDRQAGFIVDAVTEILPVRAEQIKQTPAMTGDAGRLFTRVATLDGGARLILLLEPKELLDRAERDLLASLDAS